MNEEEENSYSEVIENTSGFQVLVWMELGSEGSLEEHLRQEGVSTEGGAGARRSFSSA